MASLSRVPFAIARAFDVVHASSTSFIAIRLPGPIALYVPAAPRSTTFDPELCFRRHPPAADALADRLVEITRDS